jgi:outer membrane protein TolC
VQAGRITNPHFAFLRTRQGDERKLEWALTFPIIELFTIPLRTKIEARRFEEVKLAVAGRVLDVAHETSRTYYQAVGAEELVRYLEQVKSAAEASAELARRMARAGNFSKLTQMREQAFYAEAVAQLAQAKRAAVARRERLTQLMGLYGENIRFRLPERLPELPGEQSGQPEFESKAIAQRLDIQAAKRQAESLAESLGLTRATRFVNVLEFGPARTKEDPEPWKRGYEISLQLPIFDWGEARVGKAEELYMQSLHRVAETATNARSEVRDAYGGARTAYDTARHYRDEIVPLRKKISEENLLRYNGMLIGVFELLADAREQVFSVTAYIGALQDYWLAETDLQASVHGAGGSRRELSGAALTGRVSRDPALAGH